jgi:hypothetical protein
VLFFRGLMLANVTDESGLLRSTVFYDQHESPLTSLVLPRASQNVCRSTELWPQNDVVEGEVAQPSQGHPWAWNDAKADADPPQSGQKVTGAADLVNDGLVRSVSGRIGQLGHPLKPNNQNVIK